MKYEDFIKSIKESRENKKFEHSERHHIIPRCLGGTDDEDNLIYLTLKEHFIAHKLLWKENPDNEKLFYAYWRMCNGKIKLATPEDYEEAKSNFMMLRNSGDHPLHGRHHSKETKMKISEAVRGSNNPFYNKHHSEESKKKMSDSMKGRRLSSDSRMKLSESLSGRSLSESHKQKIGNSRSRYRGEEHPNYGKYM